MIAYVDITWWATTLMGAVLGAIVALAGIVILIACGWRDRLLNLCERLIGDHDPEPQVYRTHSHVRIHKGES